MIVVFGKTGQLAQALYAELGEGAVFVNRDDVDLARPETIIPYLEQQANVTAVINAAAYTQVDLAEQQESKATIINANAPAMMAKWCAGRSIPFVHFSTDYVFDGSGMSPHHESDPTEPVSAYGRGKLQGENMVSSAGGKYLIFRTCWVYDATGKNFLNTMIAHGHTNKEMQVVEDQWGSPTYAPHLARGALAALEQAQKKPVFPSGIYHMCNEGYTSWHGFATAIFDEALKRVYPLQVRRVRAVSSSAYPTPAVRPKNSRLSCEKLKNELGVALPMWEAGLLACMEAKGEAAGM